jgi:hypothetical protein
MFIKSELNNIYNDKKKYIIELFKSIENISELNSQLKIYTSSPLKEFPKYHHKFTTFIQ